MEYLLIKWIHILSSTLLFGTGLGSAFYLFMANKKKDVNSICFVIRYVVIADWIFTTSSVIIQLFTGIALVHLTGYKLNDNWILWALLLYFFAGICWLPVVWLQIKMHNLAKQALDNKTSLPDSYWLMNNWWIFLGSLAFPAVVIIFLLMVIKPQ